MDIDINSLSAAELDALIEAAGRRRATLEPRHPMEAPKGALEAVHDPVWFTSLLPNSNGTIAFQIRDPRFGWLLYSIPSHEIANIVAIWSRALAVATAENNSNPTAGTVATAPSGGRNVH